MEKHLVHNVKEIYGKKYFVYELLFPNKKRYFGITSKIPKRRWDNGNGYKYQPVYKPICDFGWDNIKHNILYSNLSFLDAQNKEKELIKKYQTFKEQYGYNIETGGFNGEVNKVSKIKVAQYSLDGKLIEIFDSYSDAERKTKIKGNNISMCIKNGKTAGGYQWRKEDSEFVKEIPPYNTFNKNGKAKEIIQILDGEEIKNWSSLTEAAKFIRRSTSSLLYSLKNGTKCAGYNWKYKE